MNAEWIKNLSVYQWVKLVAASLAGLLVLLLLVGAIWAVTLPPAPVVLPSPEALRATPVVLSTEDAEAHYLDGFMPVISDVDAEPSPDIVNEVDEDSSIMVSRPLFWAGRRPVVIDEAQAEIVDESQNAARASELDKVELAGVYFAGDASGAIVRVSGQRMRVPLGDNVLGWKLESVNATEIRFSNAGQEKTIRLEHAGVSD